MWNKELSNHTSLISNRYKILSQIGKGGMGEVYLAEDILTAGAKYALKIIRQDLIPRVRTKTIENFKNEIEIMTRLKHPNLVQVYDFGKYSSDYFIVMEYIEGPLFSEVIYSDKKHTLKEYLDIFIQFLRALEFIHSRYVIYRDIKPSNAIINSSNTLKLMDFGISDIFQTKEEKVKGTLFYMAPEVIEGNVDYQTDIFSLGIVFFEMLTKTRFYDKNVSQLNSLLELLSSWKSFQLLKDKNLQLIKDVRLRDIISRMTAFELNDRYQTCSEIIHDINRSFNTSYMYETQETKESYVLGSLFVNRKMEFEILKESLKTEKPYKMLIYRGASGSGKTRLFHEFMKYCKLNNISFFQAGCNEARTNYHAISKILIQAIINSARNTLNKYGKILKLLLPNLEKLKEYSDLIFDDKHLQRDIIIQNVSDFLLSFSNEGTQTVLNFDDLQWLDLGSIDILCDLINKMDREHNHNLILFGNINQTFFDPENSINLLLKNRNIRIIDLGPFSDSDIREFLEKIFGTRFIDKDLLDQSGKLKDLIGGNPLLLGELLKDMLNRNMLVKDIQFWRLAENIKSITIPANIIDIITERIIRLKYNKCNKMVLEILSISRFDLTISEIRSLAKIDDIVPSLILLENTELLRSHIFHNKKYYGFINILTKEAVRGSIASRTDLHLRIAQELCILLNDHNKGRYIEDIAFHYNEGKNPQKAIEYYLLSAEHFRKNYFNERAISCYDAIINLLNSEETIIDIRLKKAELLELLGRWHECLAIASECLNSLIHILTPIQAARAKHITGNVQMHKGNYDEALALYQEAKETFHHTGMMKEYHNVILAIGTIYNNKSDYAKAMEYYNECGKYYYETGDEKSYYSYIGNMGTIHKNLGDYKKAIDCYKKSMELSEKYGDKRAYSISICNLGNIYKNKGLADDAAQCFKTALKLSRAIGDTRGISRVIGNLGNVYKSKGEFEKALKCYKVKERTCKKLSDKKGYCIAVNNIGTIFCENKEYDKAMEAYEAYLDISKEIGFKLGHATALANIAIVHEERNDLKMALEFFLKAKKIAAEIMDKNMQGHICEYLSNINVRLNHSDIALKYNDQAIKIFLELENNHIICRLLISKAKLLISCNNYVDARNVLHEASDYAGNDVQPEIDDLIKTIGVKGIK